MPAPTVSAFPTAPSRLNPGTDFVLKSDGFVAHFSTFVPEINALGEFVEDRAGDADLAATNSAASAAASQVQANLALQYANLAKAYANFRGIWDPVTAYQTGQSVRYLDNFFVSNVDNNVNQTPVDGPKWSFLFAVTPP
jgi:hypothetical protein